MYIQAPMHIPWQAQASSWNLPPFIHSAPPGQMTVASNADAGYSMKI